MARFIEVSVMSMRLSGDPQFTAASVNVDHIIRVSPSADGARLWLSENSKIEVAESYDDVYWKINASAEAGTR